MNALKTFLALLVSSFVMVTGCSSSTAPPPAQEQVNPTSASTTGAMLPTSTTGGGTTTGGVPPAGCAAGQLECGALCVDPQSDSSNCGSCGVLCPVGTTCSAGACVCGAGLSECAAVCVNTMADVFNCGGCGVACSGSQGCSLGACSCPAGYQSCGEQCLDTTADVMNCGACGVACSSGQDCMGSACTCLAGLTDCTGTCIDTTESGVNCGGCGVVCAAGEVCSLGACSTECAAGLTQCDTSCADLAVSEANCGMCGNACPAGQSCEGGVCSCAAGQANCAGVCVNTQTNLSNCGMCGIACTGGATCVAGACSCPEGQEFCDGQCVDVTQNFLHCGSCGNVCIAGVCTDGACPTVKDCAAPRALTSPTFTDFEEYDGTLPVVEWGFVFNDDLNPAYAGPYEYNDSTGTPTIQMVAGNAASNYAIEVSNPQSSDWGGALGFWMTCIDASVYDGIRFWARGPVPRGLATLALSMEATSPPSETDPAGGGTCMGGEDCAGPTVEFPVTDTWTQVLLPWTAFEPGTNGTSSIVADGTDITGFAINLNLAWGPDPNDETAYIPTPAAYDLAVDDIEFFNVDGTCPAGQIICGGGCVDTQSNAAHCGECNNVCVGGAACTGGACVCPNGQALCNGECVDTNTSTSHCGGCGGVCAIGATCNSGTCEGGSGTTSNRCGSSMTLLGNPFQCSFGWGAHDEGSVPSYVDFVSKWVGYEQNIDSQCDGCGWLQSVGSASRIPTYMAYFIAYRANLEAGYGDCNTDFDGQNLCTHGAAFIRSNRDRLVQIYQSYAQRSYQAYPNNPVIWVVEPDLIQYVTSGTQTAALSFDELGSVVTDIICAIKSEMPNAIIAPNYSPWTQEPDITSFWTALPLDLIDLVHITGMANVPGGYINDGDANNRSDATYNYIHLLTGKPIIVDTSFGVTTMSDTWSTSPAATLNERIADGVTAAMVYPTPGDYQTRINNLSPQLSSTCQ